MSIETSPHAFQVRRLFFAVLLCITILFSAPTAFADDYDGDGVPDQFDNCLERDNGPAEPSYQLDVDQDGFGNACDPDFDQSGGTIDLADHSIFLQCFSAEDVPITGGPIGDETCEESDLNGDGDVDLLDLSIFQAFFSGEPGPSGLSCADATIDVAQGDDPCTMVSSPPVAAPPDPSAPGPYAGNVMRAIYDFGDSVFQPNPPMFPEPSNETFPYPVEFRGVVHYPGDLSNGPFPFVVIMHANARTCFWEPGTVLPNMHTTKDVWPCPALPSPSDPDGPVYQGEPIPNYLGYDYFAEHLAGHGYIVVSISTNGIASAGNAAVPGNDARAQLIDFHLTFWRTMNLHPNWLATSTNDPNDGQDLFVGSIDMERIGTMGHSSGADGIITHYLRNRDLMNGQFSIGAMLSLAGTTSFTQLDLVPPDDVPIAAVIANCDAQDPDAAGVLYFDGARYTSESTAAGKHIIFDMGATHEDYNSEIGIGIPWCYGPPQPITHSQQEANFISYGSAFFRTYLGGETGFLDVLSGAPPNTGWTGGTDVRFAYHGPAERRRDINRFTDIGSLADSEMGEGTVLRQGLSDLDICGQNIAENSCLLETPFTATQQPHTAHESPVGQLRVLWDASNPGEVSHTIPPGFGDLSKFDALQFRTSVNTDRSDAGQNLDFSVSLIDQQDRIATVLVSNHAPQALSNPGGESSLPLRLYLTTVRVPLDAFLAPAANGGSAEVVDTNSIAEVRLSFGAEVSSGGVQITDLAFSDKNFRDGLGVVQTNGSGDLAWSIDYNGDGTDEETMSFGSAGDTPVSGDWDGNGVAGTAVVDINAAGTALEWTLNIDRTTPTPNHEILEFGDPGDVPLAADFNRDAVAELVVYREVNGVPTFVISYDRTSPGQADLEISIQPSGVLGTNLFPAYPILGDWDGDGKAGVAIAKSVAGGSCSQAPCYTFVWSIDNDLDGTIDQYVFSGDATLVPVSGDYDGDGRDDFGTFGSLNGAAEAWYIDLDHDSVVDKVIEISSSGSYTPITGNW